MSTLFVILCEFYKWNDYSPYAYFRVLLFTEEVSGEYLFHSTKSTEKIVENPLSVFVWFFYYSRKIMVF